MNKKIEWSAGESNPARVDVKTPKGNHSAPLPGPSPAPKWLLERARFILGHVLESARNRVVVLPRIPTQILLSAGTLTSFGWLLLQNKMHPMVIYLLQIYLTF